VVKLQDLTEGAHIEREMMLVKSRAVAGDREEIKRLIDIFRGRVIDVTDTTYTMELTGDSDKLDAFLRALDPKLLLEVVRSGSNGIARGERSLRA
jgi:acetolactate synthase-1/3 small subunit